VVNGPPKAVQPPPDLGEALFPVSTHETN
jgi:hypothetical protein